MKHSVGLDISVKETAICIVDENGKVVRETKVTTEPEAIIAFLNSTGFGVRTDWAGSRIAVAMASERAGRGRVASDLRGNTPYEGGSQGPVGK